MAYGICDVLQCEEQTYLGWRPLTERTGRQVCLSHWNGHKGGSFDLYGAFGFRRPLIKTKPVELSALCCCGEELLPGHRLCTSCAAERERERKREYYYRSKEERLPKATHLRCAECGQEREPNYRYCSRCAKQQRRKLDRERKREVRKYKNVWCRLFGFWKTVLTVLKTQKKFSESDGYDT